MIRMMIQMDVQLQVNDFQKFHFIFVLHLQVNSSKDNTFKNSMFTISYLIEI